MKTFSLSAILIFVLVDISNLSAQQLGQFGFVGVGNTTISDPQGIAVDSSGAVYVALEYGGLVQGTIESQIQKFTSTGHFIGTIGVDKLTGARGICIDSHNKFIFVADAYEYCIKKFSLSGELLFKWGGSGESDGKFGEITDICVDKSDNLYVASDQRIQKFSMNGDFKKAWFTGYVTSLGVDPAGIIYAVSLGGNKILKYDSNGAFIEQWGTEGSRPGDLGYPFGIAIDAQGIVYVGDQSNRVQKFTSSGQFIEVVASGFTSVGHLTSTGTGIVYVVDPSTRMIKFYGQSLDFFTIGTEKFPVTLAVNDTSKIKELHVTSNGLTKVVSSQQQVQFSTAAHHLSFDLPAGLFDDPQGLKWSYSIVDKSGSVMRSPSIYTYLKYPSTSDLQVLPGIAAGRKVKNYQIIAIPLTLASPMTPDIFKDLGEYDKSVWRLFSFEDNTYVEDPYQILPGIGYWFITTETKSINPGGGTTLEVTPESPFVIKLKKGMNLIGNPYNFTILWDDVLGHNVGSQGVKDLIQFKSGSLETDNLLDRYRGAFVESTKDIDLKIPIISHPNGNGRKRPEYKLPINDERWVVNLAVDDGEFQNKLFGIGMNPEADLQNDLFDETCAPILEGVSSFSLDFLGHTEADLVKDIVPTQENFSWAASITSDHGVTLRWDNSYFGSNDKQLVFENESRVELIDMRTSTSVYIPAGKHKIKFHYGDLTYVEKQVVEKKSRVGDVYPNPLTKSANGLTVPISLPEGANNVMLRISDVWGRPMKLEGKGQYDGGRKSVFWPANFSQLASGLYLLQIDVQIGDGKHSIFYQKIRIE